MPPKAYTSSKRRKLPSARQVYRLLHERRPAEVRWSERQETVWNEIAGSLDNRERFPEFKIAITDGECEWASVREDQLLLAVGTICAANARPDIWRQIYEAWASVPAPGGEMALLAELADQARRGEL